MALERNKGGRPAKLTPEQRSARQVERVREWRRQTGRKVLGLAVTQETTARLDAYAEAHGLSKAAVIERMVERFPALEAEHQELHVTNASLNKEIDDFKNTNAVLQKENQELHARIRNLEEEAKQGATKGSAKRGPSRRKRVTETHIRERQHVEAGASVSGNEAREEADIAEQQETGQHITTPR